MPGEPYISQIDAMCTLGRHFSQRDDLHMHTAKSTLHSYGYFVARDINRPKFCHRTKILIVFLEFKGKIETDFLIVLSELLTKVGKTVNYQIYFVKVVLSLIYS